MRIRYFAWLRHRVGVAEEEVALPAGVTSLAALKEWLAGRHAGFAAALALPGVIRCAVNQEYAPEDVELRPDDEVAFFPPVTGG